MDILVDVGNRRIKWAKSIDIAQFITGEYTLLQLEKLHHVINFTAREAKDEQSRQFLNEPKPNSVYVSCVGGKKAMPEIHKACQERWNIQPNYLTSSDCKAGIRNGYLDPQQLGVDRWLAMIAARQFIPNRPLLVIDAGTAITIDYIDTIGLFEGGIIIPGLMTIMESLNQRAGLPTVDSNMTNKEHRILNNRDTHSAIVNGALHAVVSSIEIAIAEYREKTGKHLRTVITGGDASLINRVSKYSMIEFPNLVLIGLYIVTRDTDC
ncbi:MAG: type III pantothenate kinase [Gammaproteobacteria bacterium]|nr:type III pantothenate kinase [Gammaproteobacteria bacterium]MCY4217714.1 type III pantothenate kinase [Gammaproteobacteria bacterium]MCY4274130.1 type III pantothenate kinase [Gammaproteobacteria bacterium]